MPRKKKNKVYFTEETERAIIEYNKTDNEILKNKIYKESIQYPFEKLAENILNTFKFSYFDIPKADVQSDVVSTLIEKIHMFNEGKGKAFSYFSIIAKNHLILQNNGNYKRFKKTALISDMPENWNPENDFHDVEIGDEYMEFKYLMLDYWDNNLTKIFTKNRDIQIADAVLELFRRSDYVENFNKKHLYLLIREMTDCKTPYITKVVNEMKQRQIKMLNDYLKNGYIEDENIDFWNSEYL
jgi:uncharacterized C2H2 Zn-finger protein